MRARGSFVRPEWADEQVWSDFLANRKRKGLTNTATAYRKFLNDVERLTDVDWPPGRLLEAATARSWGALYPSIKDGDHEHRNGHRQADSMGRNGGRGGSSSGMGKTIDALDQWVSGAQH